MDKDKFMDFTNKCALCRSKTEYSYRNDKKECSHSIMAKCVKCSWTAIIHVKGEYDAE